jgi:AcrR family transcriptional regulator
MKRPPDDLAQKLLDVSDQFRGTGFDISIDEVAAASDVPRATLYYYFSGRDDLVSFYMNDKLDRMHTTVQKAVASEGTPTQRLERVIREVTSKMIEYPVLCMELPVALRRSEDFAEVMLNAERTVGAPLRELLIEGRAVGEFDFEDLDVTITAMNGAVMQVAMMEVLRNPEPDVDGVGDKLAGAIIRGLAAR